MKENQRRVRIETGVDHMTITPDARLTEALGRVRELEGRVRAAFATTEDDLALARSVVACGLDSVERICREDISPAELCERVIALRGPFGQANVRRNARELARFYALLAECARPPATLDELMGLHARLIAGEPFIFAHSARTDLRRGYTPFSSMLLPDEELPSGNRTLSEDRIEAETEALIAFVTRADVDTEVRAAAAYYLETHIHPFFDGNGHTGRALAALVLGEGYSASTKLAFVRALQLGRHEVSKAMYETTDAHADLAPLACLMMDMLAQGQLSLLEQT